MNNTEGAMIIALAYQLARVYGEGEGPAIAHAAHKVWQQAREPHIRTLADRLRNRRLKPELLNGEVLGPAQLRVNHAKDLTAILLAPDIKIV